jgi:RNA polymerase sigma factor (sigma-70 family)
MTIEEALHALRADPEDRTARQAIALGVYDHLLAYVASLLLTFRIAPGETAHDIVHDVLLAFYQRRLSSNSTITSESALLAYLRTSCRNLLIDKYRHERHGEELLDFLSLRFDAAFENESELYRSIFVKEIIDMLPAECASLFEQYVNEDLSPAEIADRLNASPAKFYSRWYRCIQRTKELLLRRKGGLNRS